MAMRSLRSKETFVEMIRAEEAVHTKRQRMFTLHHAGET